MLLADAGTPLIWFTGCHLVLGNAIIGLIEAAILKYLFRVRFGRAAGLMILANYFSMLTGGLGFDHFAPALQRSILGDVPILHTTAYITASLTIIFIVTILLEWPFVAFALRPSRHLFLRSALAAVLTQSTSYALLALVYSSASTNTLGQYQRASTPSFASSRSAQIYFISPRDHNLYRVALDGSPAEKVLALDVRAEDDAHLLLRPEQGSDFVGLWLWRQGRDSEKCVIPRFARTISLSFDDNPDRREAIDLRGPGQHELDAITGAWGLEGLAVFEGKDHLRVALETPVLTWVASCATILPGDQIIFQLDDQILLLDPHTRRLGFIARGLSPVVLLPEYSPTTNPATTRATTRP